MVLTRSLCLSPGSIVCQVGTSCEAGLVGKNGRQLQQEKDPSQQLLRCQSLEDLRGLVLAQAHVMSGHILSCALYWLVANVDFNRLPEKSKWQLEQVAGGIIKEAVEEVEVLTPAELCLLVYNMAKLRYQDVVSVQSFCEALRYQLSACTAKSLGQAMWGLAILNFSPGRDWMEEFCKVVQSKFFYCTPFQLAICLWGIARLGHQPAKYFVNCALETSFNHLSRLSPQQLANTIWALHKWSHRPDDRWLAQFCRAVQQQQEFLEAQEISQVLFSFVKLNYKPESEWIEVMASTACRRVASMTPLQCGNTLWALAVWSFKLSDHQMTSFLAGVREKLNAHSASSLSTLAWALGRLKFLPCKHWIQLFLATSARQLGMYAIRHHVTTVVTLARWGVKPDAWYFMQWFHYSQIKLCQGNPRQLSQLSRALGVLCQPAPSQWVTQLLTSFVSLARGATVKEMSVVLFSLPRLSPAGGETWWKENGHLVVSLVDNITPRLGEACPQDLCWMVVGLAALGYCPSGHFIDKHRQLFAKYLRQSAFTTNERMAITRAYNLLLIS